MQDIHARLQRIFKDVFEDDSIEISESTSARDIPAWDSLHHVLLISAIENSFDVQFELEELTSFENVGDIINALKTKADGI